MRNAVEFSELSRVREYADANSSHPGIKPTHAEQSRLSYKDLQTQGETLDTAKEGYRVVH